MKVDTTLFDIYTNLGLTEIMQSEEFEEFEEFVQDQVESVFAVSSAAAA